MFLLNIQIHHKKPEYNWNEICCSSIGRGLMNENRLIIMLLLINGGVMMLLLHIGCLLCSYIHICVMLLLLQLYSLIPDQLLRHWNNYRNSIQLGICRRIHEFLEAFSAWMHTNEGNHHRLSCVTFASRISFLRSFRLQIMLKIVVVVSRNKPSTR